MQDLKARSQILGMIVFHAHRITYVYTDASMILLMHRKIFGRINWLPLKRKPEDLVEEKIYFLLNIYIFLYGKDS